MVRDDKVRLICGTVCTLSLFPALRHRGAPLKHLACVRQHHILKLDIVALAGAAEGAHICLTRAGCFGSNGRRWGDSKVVPGSSSRGSAGSEVSTTSSLSDSSNSHMRGLVGTERSGAFGHTTAICRAPNAFLRHAVLVVNSVTCRGIAALPVIMPTLSPPCPPPCAGLLQLSRRERGDGS